ncbi:MAG: hypothetical protein U9R53_10210 [Chloroflexota bacterium]|nr:hypothetical protein [Chloroflexota bacterium]
MKTLFRWSKTSTAILSGFLCVLLVIGYIWWPLLQDYIRQYDPARSIWRQIDWLLIGNFLVMSILITLNAELRYDIPYGLIAIAGGFIIEAWGTQSGLWAYYTLETPPLWIIPAWPIASLSVYRLYKLLSHFLQKVPEKCFKWGYWPIFGIFFVLLMDFVRPTFSHPLTIFSVLVCGLLILTNKDKRSVCIIFVAGSALGYFLERWGTTRLCWTYYTGGFPPFFTVLAHGMATVAVWRVYRLYLWLGEKIKLPWLKDNDTIVKA